MDRQVIKLGKRILPRKAQFVLSWLRIAQKYADNQP